MSGVATGQNFKGLIGDKGVGTFGKHAVAATHTGDK